MKKVILMLLLVLLCTPTLWAQRQFFQYGELYYRITNAETHTVEVIPDMVNTRLNYPHLTSLVIPPTVEDYPYTYTVTCIGSSAFRATDLQEVSIPETVTRIKGAAFVGCDQLREVTIPESVTSVGGMSFYGCNSLTRVTLPSGLTQIGNGLFGYATNLPEVDIPEGVTLIGAEAFSCCYNLTEISLPAGVTTIQERAFYKCAALRTVVSEATTPPALGTNVFYGIPSDAILYVQESSIEAYKNSDWKPFFAEIRPYDDMDTDTGPEEETDLEDMYGDGSTSAPRKIIRGGQVMIEREGRIYNTVGNIVE